MYKLFLSASILFLLSACSDNTPKKKSSAPGMKCGAGKCGANMFDGKGALAKKKKNILSQMRENDPRKECVIKAKTTKETYNCIRSPKTNRLSLQCGADRCGSSKEQKKMPSMKCGIGKCGSSMK